jgi:hypothetical protein
MQRVPVEDPAVLGALDRELERPTRRSAAASKIVRRRS